MQSSWTIELKREKERYFLQAEPSETLPEYIGMKTAGLMEKIATLETEEILINLPDDDFAKLKAQIRSEDKRRNATRSKVHDYDYVTNKRAF